MQAPNLIVKYAQSAQYQYTSLECFIRVISTPNICYLLKHLAVDFQIWENYHISEFTRVLNTFVKELWLLCERSASLT